MSQTQIRPDEGGSSVRELDVSRTYKQEKQQRVRDSQTPHTSIDINKESEKSKEERIREAKELMENTEATDLNLEVGELSKVTSDLIVERTEDGFNMYVVSE